MSKKIRDEIEKVFQDAKEETFGQDLLGDEAKAARDIIRIERNYFYGNRASTGKLGEIRQVIAACSARRRRGGR